MQISLLDRSLSNETFSYSFVQTNFEHTQVDVGRENHKAQKKSMKDFTQRKKNANLN